MRKPIDVPRILKRIRIAARIFAHARIPVQIGNEIRSIGVLQPRAPYGKRIVRARFPAPSAQYLRVLLLKIRRSAAPAAAGMIRIPRPLPQRVRIQRQQIAQRIFVLRKVSVRAQFFRQRIRTRYAREPPAQFLKARVAAHRASLRRDIRKKKRRQQIARRIALRFGRIFPYVPQQRVREYVHQRVRNPTLGFMQRAVHPRIADVNRFAVKRGWFRIRRNFNLHAMHAARQMGMAHTDRILRDGNGLRRHAFIHAPHLASHFL